MISTFFLCLYSLQEDAVFVEEECTSVGGGKRERDTSKVSLSTQLTVKGALDRLYVSVVWGEIRYFSLLMKTISILQKFSGSRTVCTFALFLE